MISVRTLSTAAAMLAVVLIGNSLRAQPAPRIEDMSWLAGCWSFEKKDMKIEEHWLAPAGGAMLGVSRTIRGGKMIEFEFVSIREIGGKLSYVAIPSGQQETAFTLAQASASELVFENPEHDFPQRVIYRKAGDGLAARIEGKLNGKDRAVDFPYQRCR